MKTIYKYPLEITGEQTITIPKNHTCLSAVSLNHSLVLYALVDDGEVEVEKLTVRIVGTGNPIEDYIAEDFCFIATVPMVPFVWHVFIKTLPTNESNQKNAASDEIESLIELHNIGVNDFKELIAILKEELAEASDLLVLAKPYLLEYNVKDTFRIDELVKRIDILLKKQ